jgi:hypothetical protein
MTDQINEHLRGPWVAVLTDRSGFVYESVAVAVEDLGEDYDEEVEISVRRGSAAPADRFGNLRTPGSYSTGDLAYETEAYLVDPGDASVGAEARYVQAQAMAAGLNAAGGAA